MVEKKSAPVLMACAALFASMISLSVGTSFGKRLFASIGAQGTTALRVSFAALLLMLLWRPWRAPIDRVQAKALVAYGIMLGAMNLLFYMGLRTVPLGIAVAIEFSGPLVLAIWSSRRLLDFVWIGFAILGLGLLLPIAGAEALDPIGVLYVLGAATCWAGYIVYGHRLAGMHSGRATAYGMSVAAFLVLPFGIAHAGTLLLDSNTLLVGCTLAILSSAIPYSLEMFSLKHLPKQTFGVLLSVEPAFNAVAALFILHESLSQQQWFAIAFICVASIGCAATAKNSLPLAEEEGVRAN